MSEHQDFSSGDDRASAGELPTTGRSVYSAIYEASDAPDEVGIAYTIGAGATLYGNTAGGTYNDAVGIELVAGQTYVFDLSSAPGIGGPAADLILRLHDAAGTLIASNDDGGTSYNARLSYTAATNGTYYLGAALLSPAAYEPGAPNYALSAHQSAAATVNEVALQLTDGFWEWAGGSRHAFAVTEGGTLNVDISALTTEGRALAVTALATWTAVTGIVINASPNFGVPLHIVFDDNEAGAFSSSITDSTGRILLSRVVISTDWLARYGTTCDSYSFQTYIHEIGHALGLGHAGNYNGSATYGVDEMFINDSCQISVMSYFSASDNSFVGGTSAYTLTPMIADIMAVGELYGAPTSLRIGKTTYGENSDAGGSYDYFAVFNAPGAVGAPVAMTICDNGGVDTIDLRSDIYAQRVDLRQGGISDVYGDRGTLIVAMGSVIENFLAGSGNDSVIGNSASNDVAGSFGNDTLLGGAGDDTLNGGVGNDYLDGGAGNDTALFIDTTAAITVNLSIAGPQNTGQGIDTLISIENVTSGAGRDTLIGDAGANVLNGEAGDDSLSGGDGNDTLLGGDGNDTLNGGLGDDRLGGGLGVDTAVFAGTSAVQVDLRITGAQNTGHGWDTLVMIENVTSGLGNDRLTGNAGDNALVSVSGNDTLDGGYGNDTLSGGAGNDRLTGGPGDDRLDGGLGVDTIVYVGAAVTVNLGLSGPQNTGGMGIDTILNVENIASGGGNDWLIGNALANNLSGSLGNDTLDGGGGNDTLNGGKGSDVLTGGSGADSFIFNTPLGAGNIDTITDFSVVDDTIRFENAVFTGLKDGVLSADAFAANLTGFADDASDRIIYETDTGRLYFDPDGSGAGARILFATLAAGLALTNADFFVF